MTTIIFDLDGTLIDTSTLVLPAFHHALQKFSSFPEPSEQVMRKTFGMPDTEIWKMLMPNASPKQRAEAFVASEAFIKDEMYHANVLLKGARQVLQTLAQSGHTLTVASNCGVRYMNSVLDSQHIREFFTNPLCLESVHGERKADILAVHFRTWPKAEAVMVGDRASDVDAATEFGVPTIGCAFGFGDPAELQGAVTVIHALEELLSALPDVTGAALPRR